MFGSMFSDRYHNIPQIMITFSLQIYRNRSLHVFSPSLYDVQPNFNLHWTINFLPCWSHYIKRYLTMIIMNILSVYEVIGLESHSQHTLVIAIILRSYSVTLAGGNDLGVRCGTLETWKKKDWHLLIWAAILVKNKWNRL